MTIRFIRLTVGAIILQDAPDGNLFMDQYYFNNSPTEYKKGVKILTTIARSKAGSSSRNFLL